MSFADKGINHFLFDPVSLVIRDNPRAIGYLFFQINLLINNVL